MNDQELLNEMRATAKKAADFIRKERLNFDYKKVQIKGLNDLVSYVDKTAEAMIVEDLQKIVSEAGFIVEENTRTERHDYNWIVDPLDGTTNFIHGIPCFSVSIALEYKGQIKAGVVHEVNRDESFYASLGGGAFLNEQPISVSNRKTLSESLVATGFPIYNFQRLDNFVALLKHLMNHSHGIRRIGSAATDLCYLACGRVDAFFEYNLSPWDVAAGALIVKEAGGTVHDFSGGNNWLFGKEISCTNGHIIKEFEELIANFFKEK